MKIINAHAHMIDIEGMVRAYGNVELPTGIAVLSDLDETLNMLNPEVLIAQMDEAGIEKTVLYAVYAPLVYSPNEYVAAICSRYPDRLIGFASVNPLEADAPKVLENAVKNLGLKGLKMHPPLQHFSPSDPQFFPIYEKAQELNIPVVFHVGTTPFGHLCKLAHANPLLIDEIAVRYPKLRILLTHLGTLWHNESFMVVEKNPNVFIDTAAYLYEIQQIMTPETVARVGAHKFIFGTDYPMPYTDHAHRMKDFVDTVQGLKLSDKVKQQIFSDNFDRLLNGAPEGEATSITLFQMMEKISQRKKA